MWPPGGCSLILPLAIFCLFCKAVLLLFLDWISIYIYKLGDYTPKSLFSAFFEKSENGKAGSYSYVASIFYRDDE